MKGKNRFSQIFCFKQQAGKEDKNYEIVCVSFGGTVYAPVIRVLVNFKRKSNRKVYDPAEKETEPPSTCQISECTGVGACSPPNFGNCYLRILWAASCTNFLSVQTFGFTRARAMALTCLSKTCHHFCCLCLSCCFVILVLMTKKYHVTPCSLFHFALIWVLLVVRATPGK